MTAFELLPITMFVGLTLAAGATCWALLLRGGRLRAAGLLGALTVAARRGLPLNEELEGLGDTLLRGDRERTRAAAAALEAGADLPTALNAGRLLPIASAPVLAAGAATGTLPRALADEADRHARRAGGAAGTVWTAAFYVLMTLTTVQLVLGWLLYNIVPKYKHIFEDFGMTPDGSNWSDARWRGGGPEAGGSDFDSLLGVPWFEALWVGSDDLAGLLIGPAILFQLAWVALPVAAVLGQKGYRLPGAARARRWVGSRRAHASRVLRVLAATAEAGRPFPEALSAYAAAADSRGPALSNIAARVRDGADLWPTLRDGGVLRSGEARLAAAGAAAGNLPTALRVLADRLDGAADRRRGRWLALLQPLATLLIGALVGWVALAFYSPLVRLTGELGGPL